MWKTYVYQGPFSSDSRKLSVKNLYKHVHNCFYFPELCVLCSHEKTRIIFTNFSEKVGKIAF